LELAYLKNQQNDLFPTKNLFLCFLRIVLSLVEYHTSLWQQQVVARVLPDQIYFTPNLIETVPFRWRYWKAEIFNPPMLINSKGKYKGAPFRSFSNGRFTGGYSDHFPICLYLLREPRPSGQKGL
jgi:hypothetical protein